MDPASNLPHHITRAVETFAVLMFQEIQDFLMGIHSPFNHSSRAASSKYLDFKKNVKHHEDEFIIMEFISLFITEVDSCMFRFQYQDTLRAAIHVHAVKYLADKINMEPKRLTKILTIRLEAYAQILNSSAEKTLPDEDLCDQLMLFLFKTLGSGRLYETGINPSLHDLTCVKIAYMKRAYVFHSGLRHYLFRVMKTKTDYVFMDDELFRDIFEESLSITRQMLFEVKSKNSKPY